MERELGLSAVGRSCRCWRSAVGRFVREELEKEGSAGCCRMKKAPLRLEKGAAEREDQLLVSVRERLCVHRGT